MLNREQKERSQSEIICIDDLVPRNHLLRKIDERVDFTKIYDIVGKLYSADKGRPSTDPVVLFKSAIIQHIYGIPSLRRTAEEISLNIAYHWFLGYSLTEKTPHFSTFSYNFSHRFTEDVVQQIFDWILNEINDAGYLSPEAGNKFKVSVIIPHLDKKCFPGVGCVRYVWSCHKPTGG